MDVNEKRAIIDPSATGRPTISAPEGARMNSMLILKGYPSVEHIGQNRGG
ncbi:MAG: hypothetical protein JRN19_04410 [Nitrososphaerota archaeon]|nr:hypothetical protein [Nitrososphaerota archaeon]MDG7049273.1 hypothetical protein [Nitrososphaerota archaeon]MDG7051674.1 hypothetical protein [Nitrososphaerota archaeon]